MFSRIILFVLLLGIAAGPISSLVAAEREVPKAAQADYKALVKLFDRLEQKAADPAGNAKRVKGDLARAAQRIDKIIAKAPDFDLSAEKARLDGYVQAFAPSAPATGAAPVVTTTQEAPKAVKADLKALDDLMEKLAVEAPDGVAADEVTSVSRNLDWAWKRVDKIAKKSPEFDLETYKRTLVDYTEKLLNQDPSLAYKFTFASDPYGVELDKDSPAADAYKKLRMVLKRVSEVGSSTHTEGYTGYGPNGDQPGASFDGSQIGRMKGYLADARAAEPAQDWSGYEDAIAEIEASYDDYVQASTAAARQAGDEKAELAAYLEGVDAYFREMISRHLEMPGVEYAAKAGGMNLDEIEARAKAWARHGDSEYRFYNVGTVADFRKNFPEFAAGTLSERVRELVDASLTAKDSEEALLAARNARGYVDGALHFLPGDAALAQLKATTEQRIAKLGDAMQDNFTGPFHAAHVNEVFLSHALVDPAKAGATDFTTRYENGKPLYATVYLGQPIATRMANLKGELKTYSVMFMENGKQVAGGSAYALPGTDNTQTWFQLGLFADPSDKLSGATINHRIDLHEQLLKLPARAHDFTLHLGDGDISPRFTTKLSIDLAAARPALETQLAHLRELKIDYARLPEAEIRNSEFEELLLASVREFELGEPRRAVLADKGWTVMKNALGVPLHKFIRGWVAYEKDGRCFYNNLNVNSVYTGGGNYGAPNAVKGGYFFDGPTEMRCANVDK